MALTFVEPLAAERSHSFPKGQWTSALRRMGTTVSRTYPACYTTVAAGSLTWSPRPPRANRFSGSQRRVSPRRVVRDTEEFEL
jgi:hypothetical protein